MPSPAITGDLLPIWSREIGAARVRLTPTGGAVAFGNSGLTALSAEGKPQWSREFGGSWSADFGVDGQGQVVLVAAAGRFGDTPDLGSGPISGPLAAGWFDRDGNLVASRALDAGLDPSLASVAVRAVELAPTGEFAVVGTAETSSSEVTFVAKYDAGGNLLWSKVPVSPMGPSSYGLGPLALAPGGGVVVGGTFDGTLDWGSGPASASTSGFLTELDATGNVAWNRVLGDYSSVTAIAVEASQIFFAGTFAGTLQLDATTVAAQGPGDLFVATVDATTSVSLLARFASGRDSRLGALAPDGNGGVLALGSVWHDLDLGAAILEPYALGLVHLEASGEVSATIALPTSDQFFDAYSLARDGGGNVYVSGRFLGAIDLGQGLVEGTPATYAFTPFIAKYGAGGAAPESRTCPPPSGALLGNSYADYPQLAALAGETVVISTGTDVIAVPSAGGALRTLALAQRSPVGLAANADVAYWINAGSTGADGPAKSGAVVSVPLAGGAPVVLADAQDAPVAIALDDRAVYWTVGQDTSDATQVIPGGSLRAVPLGGGPSLDLASGYAGVGPVAARGGVVVFAADQYSPQPHLIRVSRDGGAATVIATADRRVTSLAVGATDIYWSDAESLSIGGNLQSGGRIWTAPLDGGSPRLLIDQQATPHDLVLAGDTLYWADGAHGGDQPANPPLVGGIWQIPTSGGAATALVKGLSAAGVLAADDHRLAWVESDVSGWRLVIHSR